MKRIQYFLPILILLGLGACTLQMPGVETPPAIVSGTETPFIAEGAATDTAVPTALPAVTDTAPAPSGAEATPGPDTTATATATLEPEPADSDPTATEPAPTATQPAATATFTSTPAKTFDPYSAYGTPTYQNRMEVANRAEWAPPETDRLPDNRNIRLEFEDGELSVTGKRSLFSTWWFSYHSLDDAYIEMTFDSENCSGEDAYGMIFRGPPHLAGESFGYVVAFTCSGRLWVYRLDGIDPWDVEILVDEEKRSAINAGPDEQNVIGVRAEGDQITIFANGRQVAEVEDDQYEEGRIGVFVRAGSAGAYTYRLTNLAYWILGEGQ